MTIPDAFAGGAAYVNRHLMPIAETAIPVADRGFTRSDAVYDVVHVFGGLFRLMSRRGRVGAGERSWRGRLGIPGSLPERLDDLARLPKRAR